MTSGRCCMTTVASFTTFALALLSGIHSLRVLVILINLLLRMHNVEELHTKLKSRNWLLRISPHGPFILLLILKKVKVDLALTHS